MMGLTTDPNDECLREIEPSGMQKCYLVLSEEERAKGFVRPLRRSYTHLQCGSSTRMGLALCETYARDPSFYGGTFCSNCHAHFPLKAACDSDTKVKPAVELSLITHFAVIEKNWGYAFVWDEDGEGVGS